MDKPWIIRTDFNAILDSSEMHGGTSALGACPNFANCFQASGLVDMRFRELVLLVNREIFTND